MRTFCLFIFLFALSVTAYSQKAGKSKYGVFCEYLKPDSRQSSDEVASNVLKISNNTNRGYNVVVQTMIPQYWNLIGASEKQINIGPGDSMFIPIRIVPDRTSQGNTNYIVSSSLLFNGTPISTSNWSIEIQKISLWTCNSSANNIYFSINSDTADFSIQLRNLGNSFEMISLNLNPTNDLLVMDTNEIPFNDDILVNLKPGEFREFFFKATPEKREMNPEKLNENEHEDKKYSVRVKARNMNSNGTITRVWNGNIDFISLPNEHFEHEKNYRSLPLTVSFNTYNILSDNTYLTLDMYGNRKLRNNGQLLYYYQTNFTSNYLNSRSYLGRYHYFGYFTERYALSLGSVSSSAQGAILSGNGVKAMVKNENHKLEGIFVKGPFFFEQNYLTGYALNYIYSNKFWTIDNYAQRKENTVNKVNTNLYQHNLNMKLNRRQNLSLGLGLSEEAHYFDPENKKKVNGYLFKLNYNNSFGKFRFSLNSKYGSKNYSEFRGIGTYQLNSFYRVNKTFNIYLGYNRVEHNPEYYRKGMVVEEDFYSRKDALTVRFSYLTKMANIVLTPQVLNYNYLGLKTISKLVNLDYKQRTLESFIFYATAVGGYVNAIGHNFPEFFVASLRGTVRYKLFSLNIRYYYGPYYTREQVEFINNRLNPQRIYINLLYDHWLKNNQTLIRINTSYNNNILYKRTLLSIRPEVFHYTKNDFRLSIYGRYVFYSQGNMIDINDINGEEIDETSRSSNFEVGFGIKKDIGFPVSFRKFYDLKVSVFRDINGNGRRDPDEPGIQDVMVTLTRIDSNTLEEKYDPDIDRIEIMTNKKGKAVFNNLEMGHYHLVSFPVNGLTSFSNQKKLRIEHTSDRQIDIAISRGAKLSGSIFLEREKFADEGLNIILANIRVTAVDSMGNTFSTLTNSQGQFNMYLPAGQYDIIVNEAVLGKRFEFVRNKLKVNINNNVSHYSVGFYVREKTRKLNIKKF